MLADILYVESQGNYVQFVTTTQKVMSRLTMQEVEALLPASAFLRVHRSYIVAKLRITKLDRTTVWLQQIPLAVGPGYAEHLLELLR